MYILQVLNSADEWELITSSFASEEAAVEFYNTELGMFEDYKVVKVAEKTVEDDC